MNKLSKIYKDQPEDPMTRAVYWVEYVMRHKGAPHMRSAGRFLNVFQYHSVDVILAYLTIFTVFIYFIVYKFLLCWLCTKVFNLIVKTIC